MVLYITFTKRDLPVPPLPEEIMGLIQHYAHHILHNLWTRYEPH